MKRQSNRREFLKGRAAADALADTLGGQVPDANYGREPASYGVSPKFASNYLIHVSRRAMACEFEVTLNAGQYGNDTDLALKALDLIDSLEDQMSVFRETSELSYINRLAPQEPVVVEPRLFELLQLASELYESTDGAFDITATPLWEIWGFARREGSVPSQEALAAALLNVGTDKVELDGEKRTIRFRQPRIRLNLGSIGKGYALDRCAQALGDSGVTDFLMHGGGSSVLARGTNASLQTELTKTDEDAAETANAPNARLPKGSDSQGDLSGSESRNRGGWSVGIRHPLRPDRRLGEIRLRDRALATSGSRAQSFVHRGQRYGHILDPRTGQPAESVLSATVVAPTAAMADALSTAFYVMGPSEAMSYCRAHPEIGAVILRPVRHKGGFEIETAGLDASDFTLF